MTEPVIVDTHVHFYGDNKQYLLSKATYEVWEYGFKENVRCSTYGGDPEDILRAMDAAGASKAVMVNLLLFHVFVAVPLPISPKVWMKIKKRRRYGR